jgi:hypothetical protein
MDAKTLIARILFAASIIASTAFTPLALGNEGGLDPTPLAVERPETSSSARIPSPALDPVPAAAEAAPTIEGDRVGLLIPYRKHLSRNGRSPASDPR